MRTRTRILGALALGALATVLALAYLGYGRRLWRPYVAAIAGRQSHEKVLARIGPLHRPALQTAARGMGSKYPPDGVQLVGLKHEGILEVWVPSASGWQRFRSYPVLAASGRLGPKLREGDRQVPEGVYRLTAFNPNSSYHLSIRVDYPNRDDRAAAAADGRTQLGGDIYIHGKAVSIGCLAIGDHAIEELYVLLADVGLGNSKLILSPSAEPQLPGGAPRWQGHLYDRIRSELKAVRGVSRTRATVGRIT